MAAHLHRWSASSRSRMANNAAVLIGAATAATLGQRPWIGWRIGRTFCEAESVVNWLSAWEDFRGEADEYRGPVVASASPAKAGAWTGLSPVLSQGTSTRRPVGNARDARLAHGEAAVNGAGGRTSARRPLRQPQVRFSARSLGARKQRSRAPGRAPPRIGPLVVPG